MRILVINGPNLNLLGLREPEIYGKATFSDLEAYLRQAGQELGLELELFQSNHEGAIVDKIQAAYGQAEGIVINPAAYSHTSIAILDALKAVSIPTVEVHLTDIRSREAFRRHSYISEACLATISGHGFAGYREALALLSQAKRTRA